MARTRFWMVQDQLRARGIRDECVLEAVNEIPREEFLEPAARAAAYDDAPQPIGFGQTISQPYIVAYMTMLLNPTLESRVLEIGTGSGYQTALLAKLSKHVWTIERVAELSRRARGILAQLGMSNVSYRIGDGSLGWAEEAPFDRILVTAGAPSIPEALTSQLADGGRLLIPAGGAGEQRLIAVDRRGDRLVEMPDLACRFVKLVGEQAWHEREGDSGR